MPMTKEDWDVAVAKVPEAELRELLRVEIRQHEDTRAELDALRAAPPSADVMNAIMKRDVLWLEAHEADRTDYATGLTADDIRGMVKRRCLDKVAGPVFPYRLMLHWELRRDGYWNADCPCGAALCGVATEPERIAAEAWHFESFHVHNKAETERYAAIHRFAFAPEQAAWLETWNEYSAEAWAAQRASTTMGATMEQVLILNKQDAHRKEMMLRMLMLGRLVRK